MKKGQTHFKFIRPMSNMRIVLSAVEQGNCTHKSIQDASGLFKGQVRNALKNLCFIRAVLADRDECGRFIYIIPRIAGGCLDSPEGHQFDIFRTTKLDN